MINYFSKSIILSLLNLFLPSKKINKKLFKVKDDDPLELNYEEAEKDFDTVNIILYIYFVFIFS